MAIAKLEPEIGGYSTTPAITVEDPGYLGNRLIRYFVAKALAAQLRECTISNFSFPEWGFSLPAVDPKRYRETILIETIEQLDFSAIADAATREPSLHIVIRHYLQRQELFLAPEAYRAQFPVTEGESFGDDTLLINIRAGDILSGFVDWYPLIPIGFYRWIVDHTRLKPVFVGQLDSGSYVDALRRAFPDARFIMSAGAISDFDMLRRASNVLPAVSTFSLAAAWLSHAKRVFLPLNGFLNPRHRPEINLAPVEDARYRFFLFPLNHALPECQAMEQHLRMDGRWREISRNQLRILISAAPFVTAQAAAPESQNWPDFDPIWYVHTYIDAAMEISEGWYESALHHYLDVGRKRGHRPSMQTIAPVLPDLALGAKATQSSLSPWSRGTSVESDAGRAVNGDLYLDYAFHTAQEDNPWWMVDLGRDCDVSEMHIYNRIGEPVVIERVLPLLVQTSPDGKRWFEFCTVPKDIAFGGPDISAEPLTIKCQPTVRTRFVRLMAMAPQTCLHLLRVRIYGLS